MIIQNKRIQAIVLTVALLLLIPLIAMQFTEEVNWSFFDFVVAGILLLGTGLAIEFVTRKVKNKDYRLGLLAVIVLALFLIWAELAVGIIGTPFAGN